MSFQFPIDKRSQDVALAMGMVDRLLQEAYLARNEADGLTQKALAEKLDVDRSVVHRRLNGGVNHTIRSIAETLHELDFELAPLKLLDKRVAAPHSNYIFHKRCTDNANWDSLWDGEVKMNVKSSHVKR